MKTLLASDVMRTKVLTVPSDMKVVEAARVMLQNKISGLPVIDREDRIVGIITEGDLLRRSETGTERHRSHWLELLLGPGRAAEEYAMAHACKVSEVMSGQIASVAADTPLEEVVALMEHRHIKRVPVLDGKQLVGIISRADLLQALVDAAPEPNLVPLSDAAIRDFVLAEIDRQLWSPRATINIEVKDGVVELRGCITDERERTALNVLAENIRGVKKVVDHFVWIEPMSGMVLEPFAEPISERAESTQN